MTIKSSILLLFSLMISLCNASNPSGGNANNCQDLTVIISFNSFNKKSIDFFKEKLAPVYDDLTKCVKWRFIPCSTSHIVEEVLQCVEGVTECQLDVLHACAAHIYEDDEVKLGKYFICMMTDDSQFLKGEGCAKATGLDWERLRKCKPSVQAGDFCNNRYNQLTRIGEKFVPGVIFNWKYDLKAETAALADLKGTICDQLKTMGKTCAACPPPCSG